MESLLLFGAKLKALLPCILGALLAAVSGPRRALIERVLGFCVGFCVAVYGTDPVLDIFSLKPDTYSGGVAFAMGYFGMTFTDALMQTPWLRVIKQRLGVADG